MPLLRGFHVHAILCLFNDVILNKSVWTSDIKGSY